MAICNLMIILSVSVCLVGNLRTPPSVNAVVFVCICRVVPSLPSSFTSPQQTVEISRKMIWLLQIFCHWTQNMTNDEYKSVIMVFCYRNCSDLLLWEKIVLVFEKKLLKIDWEQSHIFYILITCSRCIINFWVSWQEYTANIYRMVIGNFIGNPLST